jgi:hypothetical protein
MSPTYYVVEMARLDAELKASRGNLQRLQQIAQAQTNLMRGMYGQRLA